MTLRTLLAQLGKVLLVMVACHVLLLCLSLWVYPVKHDVDVLAHDRSVYRGHFKSAVYGALESGFRDGRPVVIVGSSNALLGFRPDEVAALLPGAHVHNLSTPSIRAEEIRELVELAWNVMPEQQRRRTTFVVPLTFASFPGPKSFYGERVAGVAQEIRQSGLFREVDGRFVPRWTGLPLTVATSIRRPLAFAETLSDDLSGLAFGLRQFLTAAFYKHTIDPTLLAERRPREALLFPRADSADAQTTNLAFFRAALGGDETGLSQAQFDELSRLCAWADANHVDLVLVGMPVPGWVRDGLPYPAQYRDKLEPILRAVEQSPSVRFVDLADADLPLWDATHPAPGKTTAWAESLVAVLNAKGQPDHGAGGTRQ